MNGERHWEEQHEAYKKQIVQLNVRWMGEFISGDARGLSRITDKKVNGRDYAEAAAVFLAGQAGDMRKISAEHGPSELLSGSIFFGYPDMRKKESGIEPEDAGVLAIEIFCDKFDESAKEILKESVFCFNVAQAKSVRDLFTAIDLYPGKIFASGKREISKEDIKSKISQIISGKIEEHYVTSNYGLRDKVVELKAHYDSLSK